MLLVSNGNATAVVDRLEADGLAKRTQSQTDRRTIFVTLTAAGFSSFEQLAMGHEGKIDHIFATLSDAELDTLTDIFKRLGQRTIA